MLDTLEDVFRKGRAAVFCGAGISAASGIPLAGTLVEATLDILGATDNERRHVGGHALPFETFMETLRLEGTHEDHLLLFREGSPAPAHTLFAALAKDGRLSTVCTTNFDLLFERAFSACGVAYEVIYRNEDLTRAPWAHAAKPLLIKIHGSADDLENMAVTLRLVAGQSMSLPRAEAIRFLFRDGGHDTVLVIGYSASDRFDLNPAIAAHATSGKAVFVIDHVTGKNDIEARPLSAVESPFREYLGNRLQCDANWLIDALWQRLQGARPPALPAPPNLLDRWRDDIGRFSAGSKNAALGSLLFRASQHGLAAVRYFDALDGLTDSHARISVLMKFGNALRNLGKLHEAVSTFHLAVNEATSFGDKAMLHQALTAKAGGLMNLGKINEARPFLQQAWCLIREAGIDRTTLGETLGIIAEGFWRNGDNERAMRALEDAIGIAREVGDVRGLSGRLGNLAIIHMNERRIKKAEAALKEAREFSQLAGDLKGEAFVVGSLAHISLDRGDYEEARKLNVRALELFRAFRDQQGEARVLGNLGLVSEHLGDRLKALEYYAESRRLAIEIGDQQVLQAALHNLARLGFS